MTIDEAYALIHKYGGRFNDFESLVKAIKDMRYYEFNETVEVALILIMLGARK